MCKSKLTQSLRQLRATHRLDLGVDSCYSIQMRRFFLAYLVLTLLLILLTSGCAYTAVSTGSYVLTGKSVGDHAASVVTQNNCDATRYVIGRQDYWCERARELGTTYNRNPY